MKSTNKKDMAAISNFRDKNEKAAWMRKKRNLEAIIKEINPLEDRIMELTAKKQVLIDEIDEIRKIMMVDCVHPQDYLVHHDTYVKCRFCEYNISIPRLT